MLQNAAINMLFSKASDGDFIGNGWVSEYFTFSEFLFRPQMIVPNRLEVRPEAFPKSISMSAIKVFCNIRINSPTKEGAP